jgi:signal transduction histidine kinase
MHARLAILLASFMLLLMVHAGNAQRNTNGDSLLISLNSIQSKADTTHLQYAFFWIGQSQGTILLDNKVWTAINQLKGLVADDDYYDMVIAYVDRLLTIDSKESNERALETGMEFINQNRPARFSGTYYRHLFLFRELRKAFRNLGRLNESILYYSEAERKFLANNDSAGISIANNVLSGSYFRLGMQEKAVYHQGKSIAYLNDLQNNISYKQANIIFGIPGKLNRFSVLGYYYLRDNKLKEADSCLKQAIQYYHRLDSPMQQADVPYLFMQNAISKSLSGSPQSQLHFDTAQKYLELYQSPPYAFAVFYQERAVDLIRLEKPDLASFYLKRTEQLIDSFHLSSINSWGEVMPDYYRAQLSMKRSNYNEAIRLLQNQKEKLATLNLRPVTIKVLVLLAGAYAGAGNTAQAYATMQEAFELNNSVIQDEKEARTVSFETERKIQENETAIMVLNAMNEGNRKTSIYLIGIIALLVMLAFALAIFYISKRKAGRQLSAKNSNLEKTLEQLKATQSQLIQSEKMASLGELTAGIAHEIQNPLNFVNNFSEVSNELIGELVEEVDKGNSDEVKLIARDVQKNLEKINHHGKRADAIVKGMLAHSRTSTGQKEPTDINALCDEYLRLAYHGLKARDNSFEASFRFEPDNTLPKIEVVPQDIGRVLLNLINNAFQACTNSAFSPLVTVSTKKLGDRLEISVKDNGPGIPDAIKEKIFQPFFTTKPTGQGTGLGLSLSYDIVKAHGGELKLETTEGEGATFSIHLPVNPVAGNTLKT